MLVAFIDQVLFSERVAITDPSTKLEPLLAFRSNYYLGNLTRIMEGARAAGVQFIVANQQATSAAPYPRAKAERLALKGVTYDQEVTAIIDRMQGNEEVTSFEYSLVVHDRLMMDLGSDLISRTHPKRWVTALSYSTVAFPNVAAI
jgi:hypothetical protein